MLLKKGAAYHVIGIFGWGLFLSFMLRTVNAGIASDLSTDLSLSNAQLGSLSSAFFLGFSIMQLPLGILLDRLGARRVQAVLLLIAAVACWGFSLSHSYGGLWLSRALMGVGTAGALMAALKAFRFWYAANRQQLLSTLMLIAGTSGALFATVPVRWAVDAFGWRSIFATTGFLLLLVAIAIALLIPRDEEQACQESSRKTAGEGYIKENLSAYQRIFTDRYFWRFGAISMFTHGGIGAMQSLWLGPWLTEVYGLSLNQMAERLLYFNLAMLLGYMAQVLLVRYTRLSQIPVPVLIACVTVAVISLQLSLVFWHHPLAWLLWLALAVFTTFFTILLPHVSLSFPQNVTGRAYVAYNILIFSGNWLVQLGFGSVVQTAEMQLALSSESAFRLAMLVWAGVQCFGLLWLLISRATPSHIGK